MACIKTIRYGGVPCDGLPNKLKTKIFKTEPCCFELDTLHAFTYGHYDCFVKAYKYKGLSPGTCTMFTCLSDEEHLNILQFIHEKGHPCLLYTSDAADD